MKRLLRVTCLLYAALCLPVVGGAQAARMNLEAFGRIVRLADPQLSPDGKSIAVVVSRANFDENRYDAELTLVDVATGARRALAKELRGVSSPRWSPTGDRIAFLATVGGTAPGSPSRAQIHVLLMPSGEARRASNAPEGVQQFVWSPDGRSFAYATRDEAEKKEGIERHNASFEITNDDYLVQAAARPTHIWIMPAEGGSARRLTSGTWSLPTSFPPGPPASPLSWSSDGKLIAFTRVESPHSGDFDQSRVHVLDVTSGVARPLTGRAKFESQPVFSPDGSRIAFSRPRGENSNNITEIFVAPVAGSPGTSLTSALDRQMARALWIPDGQSLIVGANDGTKVSLWLQPLSGAARRLDLGSVSPASSFWVDMNVGHDGALAFVGSTPTVPAELYYMASTRAAPRRLTDLNATTAALALGRTEVIEWESDGFRHNGTVTYPPDFEQGRKYPLVLVIHGGPRAASLATFAAQAQLFAARGWVVFQPNYRGSDQLGQRYQSAITNDAGAGPGRDVMAGLEALKKRGFVDESRVAVSGWSYGGYMTTWLLGNYTGWRVAVAGAPVTDWMDQYNLGDANVRRAYGFGGSPWTSAERMKAYAEQSPITYAPKIRTPTLIMTNTGDYRVPPTQAFKLYHALKDNGVETRFIGYPQPGHNAVDPVSQRDVQRRWMEWIDQYFRGTPATSSRD
jgi:dipeptidyl aminopeptidase/acylaminoacyl peptidase